MENAVLLRKLSKTFGKSQVLKNIDLELAKGQFTVIFGPNGAGKTTLLKLIATLFEPSTGSVFIQGLDTAEVPEKARKEIGFISHEAYLYGELSAAENLRFFGKMYGLKKEEIEARIPFLLRQIGLEARAETKVCFFSRGMKQRLSIARALLHFPSVLLLDEPYTGLDPKAVSIFEKLLKSPEFEKNTRIMVSHDLKRSYTLCDRALVLKAGRLELDALKTDFTDFEDFKTKCSTLLI